MLWHVFLCCQVVKNMVLVLKDQLVHLWDKDVDLFHFRTVLKGLAALKVYESQSEFHYLEAFIETRLVLVVPHLYLLQKPWDSLEYIQEQLQVRFRYRLVFLYHFRVAYLDTGKENHFQNLSRNLWHRVQESLKKLRTLLNPFRHAQHFAKQLVHKLHIILTTNPLNKVEIDLIAFYQVRYQLNHLSNYWQPFFTCGHFQKFYPVRNEVFDDTIDGLHVFGVTDALALVG